MRILICTDDGLYELFGRRIKRICCDNITIYDLKPHRGSLYICSSDKGVIRLGGGYENVLEGSCWRLIETSEGLIASLDGPKLYLVSGDRAELLADYRGYASRLGWWFPEGSPHITDLVSYRGFFVASVEVGNLMRGKDPASLEPLSFSHDQHNLLVVDDLLLIATASGVYYTEDLEVFNEAKGSRGYFHALEKCGDLVIGHVMSARPLRISRDHGRSWDRVDIELPSPTYGVTGVACIDEERAIYSSSAIYEIDLKSLRAEKLFEKIPMTRRVIVLKDL